MEALVLIPFLLYPLMGLIQVLTAIVNRCDAGAQSREYTKRLDIYLIGVVMYFLILYLGVNTNIGLVITEPISMMYLFILPWGLAIYNWRTRAYRSKETDPDLLDDELTIEDVDHSGYFI